MTDPRIALAELVEKLSADGDLSEDDLRQIHDAAVAQANVIVEAKAWAEHAHVHEAPHLPVVTLEKAALEAYLADPEYREVEVVGKGRERLLDRVVVPPEERVPEHVDASAVMCCDCRRALVSDAGTEPILVCPTLHGRRPRHLVPGAGEAVECGHKAA